MFDNDISLNSILVSIEGTLKIEHTEEAKVDDVLLAAKQRLENTYSTVFDKDVFTLQSESQLTSDNINILLKNVSQCLAQLSLFIELKLYHKNLGIALADVNYLGYSKEKLLVALRYLQDIDEYYKHHEVIIQPLHNTLNNISMCTIKRLFIILLMFDDLGIIEGVAIVANLLYIGGLIV